jgi:hypothetical protein
MTHDDRLMNLLTDWLEEQPDTAPDQLLDTFMTELQTAPQRAAWKTTIRRLTMFGSNAMRYSMAAGGMVLAVVIGVALWSGQPAGLGGSPTPTPTAAPTSTPSASPPPSPTALQSGETELEPGMYSTLLLPYRYSFTVTEPGWVFWREPGMWGLLKEPSPDATVVLFNAGPIAEAPTDACSGLSADPGPTVDDFAAALAATVGFETTQPTDVTVGAYQGKRVVMTVPEDVDFSGCTNGEYRSLPLRDYRPGDTDDVRILDLDGTRHVLSLSTMGSVPSELVAEMEQIFESVQIDR